jgi:hypothetical protein
MPWCEICGDHFDRIGKRDACGSCVPRPKWQRAIRRCCYYALYPPIAAFGMFTLIVIIPLTKLFDSIRRGEYFE